MPATPAIPNVASRKPPLVSIVLVVAILYVAKEVLIPLALSILLAFLLGPAARRLERTGVWRGLAVTLVAGVFFLALGGIVWTVVNQAVDLADKLPTYQTNIVRKITSLRGPGGSSLSKAAKVVEDINKQFDDAPAAAGGGGGAAEVPVRSGPRGIGSVASPNAAPTGETAPLAVRVIEPTLSPTKLLGNLAGPILGPIGTAGVVIVFTIFLLIQREDLRDRLLHVVGGAERLSVTTQAADEAGKRVSRYLLSQAAVNVTVGILLALGLWAIGVPNAALWGLLMALLRFVPFLGAPIAAAFPLLLSVAVFDSWRPMLLTVGLLVVLELTFVNVVEPMVFSHSTGVSSLAVIVAATFWTWLWGPVGLLLATPFTVCIVVLGRYVPQLEFLHTLLGDEPVLPPDARLYQRLLAGDQEAVAELADEYLEEHSPAELYDTVLIPALNQAQTDSQDGKMPAEREAAVRQTTEALLEDVRERGGRPANGATGTAAPAAVAPAAVPPSLLILPAKTGADEAAGQMLAHALALANLPAEVLSHKLLVQEVLDRVEAAGVTVVCVSVLRPFAVMQARHLCKRLHARDASLRVIVGLWDTKNAPEGSRRHLQESANGVENTIAGAVATLRGLAPPPPAVETSPSAEPPRRALVPVG